ncbi:MAG: cyclodeaminase/cyclohydrolase family protein [Thermotogae bacterium]|nr:cyclodeaminase/cyclohydrolase family protein [Thermotogota bacterium]
MDYGKMSVEEFLSSVASDKPTPGGGAVGALVAALSMALVGMVSSLTLKKKDISQDVRERFAEIRENAIREMKIFIAHIEEDCDAFDEVMKAFKMPKKTEKEKKKRNFIIQQAMKRAAEVPLQLAERVSYLKKDINYVIEFGNKNAVSDAKSASILANAAVEIALENVNINLPYIKDGDFVKEIKRKIARLEGYFQKAGDEL